jgi:hypothetical protein
MSRITCKTPSSAKPITITVVNLGTDWVSVAEAPDFSVPDTAINFPTRDPEDSNRAIRPGEVYFVTPMAVKNKTTTTTWIEVQMLTEAGITVSFGKTYVPGDDTSFLPLQGRSLLKRIATATNGDRLQIRAETTSTFDIWMAAEERLSNEHIGIVNG